MSYEAPRYKRGDTAYLRESAARGFLEAHTIAGVSRGNQEWIYTVLIHPSRPLHAPHYGERRSMVTGATLIFEESEFIDLCAALTLAELYHANELNVIRAKMATHCGMGTSGT